MVLRLYGEDIVETRLTLTFPKQPASCLIQSWKKIGKYTSSAHQTSLATSQGVPSSSAANFGVEDDFFIRKLKGNSAI